MSLFPIVDGRARFDASGNVDSDRYSAGIRFTQEGAARSTTSAGTFFNQGIPMSATGQVSVVDASAGLPAGTIYHNGLPMNGDRVCISNKPVAVVSSGIPYDSAGAVAATVAPITNLPTLDLVFAGTATDPLDAASMTDDTLSLNFTSEAYQIAAQYAVWGTGGLQAVNFSDIVTFTRASTATYFDSAGVLQSAAIDTARFDYDPSTLALRGLLIEEQRTNSIRNNTMQGAVAGTPGTLPTNWVVNINTTTGLTRSVIGTGTEDGISYIDIRVNGTSLGAGALQIIFEQVGIIAASNNQTWAPSLFYKIAGGSIAGLSSPLLRLQLFNNVNASIGTLSSAAQPDPTTASLRSQRISSALTTNNAATAFVYSDLRFAIADATAIDITLRIGMPQLELGAFATSVIPTTTTALTRSADVASVNTLSPWFNSTEGGLYVEWQSNPTAYARYLVSIEQAASSATRIDININAGNTVNPRTVVSGAAVATLSGGTYTAGTIAKVAFGYKSADYASSFNGAAAVTATTAGALPSSLATMYLGSITGGTQANGYLRRVTYYPRRLANADLQTLTA